jgi:catechol 2,3-dioxygenase-like lactoylglutathione lyase family enzyme
MLPANERPLPHFQRAALVVGDLDRALAVYRDLLGFSLEYVAGAEAESFACEVFGIPEQIEIRFAALSSKSQQRTLALIEAPGLEFDDRFGPRAAVVLQVESVPATLAGAVRLGLKTCKAHTVLAPAKGPPRTESAFYDHDGHPVVIYQLEDVP